MSPIQISPQGAALLAALRVRALKRNAVRAEMRGHTKTGQLVQNDQLDTWKAYQLAEAKLAEALMQWETSEGISD